MFGKNQGTRCRPSGGRSPFFEPADPGLLLGRLSMARAFPFSAIAGQDEMKRALIIVAIDPSIGRVLVFGDRGTGKSTAIRALAATRIPRPHCAPRNVAGGKRRAQKERPG